jgi:hypothetical protein
MWDESMIKLIILILLTTGCSLPDRASTMDLCTKIKEELNYLQSIHPDDRDQFHHQELKTAEQSACTRDILY